MSWAAVAAAVVTAVATAYSANEQSKTAARARQSQEAIAKEQLDAQQAANNRASAKQPNTQGLLGDNAAYARQGVSGTLLTSPQGVNQDQLKLGKTGLLGQ